MDYSLPVSSVHEVTMSQTQLSDYYFGASLVAQMPAVQETQVLSLGWEEPLEKEMATHSVSLPGKSHGQRSLMICSPWGPKEST